MLQFCPSWDRIEVGQILLASTGMQEKTKKFISDGVVIGKKILSITERVLIEIIESMEDMQYMQFHTYSTIGRDVREMRYESEAAVEARRRRAKLQAIRRLKRQKYLRVRKEGEDMIYELTNNGKIRAIKTIIRFSDGYFFDGRVCLVTFDFPEPANGARKEFRRLLKSLGFEFVQGSVWSIGKDVAAPVRELLSLLKISRWVKVYVAQK